MTFEARHIQRGILLFWTLWFALVAATNLCDGLKALDVLGPGWSFSSGNYAFMGQVTAQHHAPPALVGLLFTGVTLWEALAALLFALALRERGDFPGVAVRRAFTVSLALWATFCLADEIFIAYQVEATHVRMFVATTVSLLLIEALERRSRRADG